MIHRVPAPAIGIRRLNDNIPAQIADDAAKLPIDNMIEPNGPIQYYFLALYFFANPLLGFTIAAMIAMRRRDDESIAGLPLRNFAQDDAGIALLRRVAERQPGTRHRATVDVHASAAADD